MAIDFSQLKIQNPQVRGGGGGINQPAPGPRPQPQEPNLLAQLASGLQGVGQHLRQGAADSRSERALQDRLATGQMRRQLIQGQIDQQNKQEQFRKGLVDASKNGGSKGVKAYLKENAPFMHQAYIKSEAQYDKAIANIGLLSVQTEREKEGLKQDRITTQVKMITGQSALMSGYNDVFNKIQRIQNPQKKAEAMKKFQQNYSTQGIAKLKQLGMDPEYIPQQFDPIFSMITIQKGIDEVTRQTKLGPNGNKPLTKLGKIKSDPTLTGEEKTSLMQKELGTSSDTLQKQRLSAFKNEVSFRNQYLKESEDFVGIATAYSQMNDLLNTEGGLADQAIIRALVKLTESGSARISDADVATLKSAGLSWGARAKRWLWDSAVKGKGLTADQRRQIKQVTRNLYKSVYDQQLKRQAFFKKKAKSIGFDSDTVVGGVDIPKLDNTQGFKPNDRVTIEINGQTVTGTHQQLLDASKQDPNLDISKARRVK